MLTHAENASEVHAYLEEVRQNHEKRTRSATESKKCNILNSKFHVKNPSSYVVRNSQYYYMADESDEKNSSNATMLCDQCPFITTSIEELHDHVSKVHMHKYK